MQMRRYFNYFLLMFSVLPLALFAKGGIYGTFLGEENEFVCYPSVHRNFFLAIFGGVLLAGIFAWSRFRLKSRTAKQLEDKNRVIEEQNKDILDSIRYASRLQHALEPEKEEIEKILPQSFFYLRPRDIVGGDFYFAEEHKGKVVIAAIDCTGHGVPGAFLTFIGHNALRNALEKTGSLDPSVILDAMNTEVKKSLGQQRAHNELNDGMEVGLCVFDRTTRELAYAGAGTSLQVVSNGSLSEIKGMKCSVGFIQDHVKSPPPAHVLKLNAGDMFYLNSDGIPDQFGGPDGKKFQRDRLRKMLEEIAQEPTVQQRSTIESRINEWMKGYNQTDDMLVVGVRA
jgi:serine phosphatase RsbU (regulator of sigma subunit)